MATIMKRLCDTGLLSAAAVAKVTNASGHTTQVQFITLHNVDVVPHRATIYRVPDNATAVGTAAAANQQFTVDLAPGQTLTLPLLWVLEDENDTVQALADTADKVAFSADGQDKTA